MMNVLIFIGSIAIGTALGHFIIGPLLVRWLRKRERATSKQDDHRFSENGYSVEVDCRICGKFNRVPGHRLRDRPKCGQCKARLMPRRRIVLCRVNTMDGVLRDELNEAWTDEDVLWQRLADHVMLETKAKEESKKPNLHVVN